MSSLLLALQEEVAARLATDPALSAVVVLTEREHHLAYETERETASLGILCVALTPEAGARHRAAPGPHLDDISVTLRIQENVALNTGPRALEVAERAAALLHQWQPPSLQEPLFAAAKTIARMPHESLLTYEVRFESGDGYLAQEVL